MHGYLHIDLPRSHQRQSHAGKACLESSFSHKQDGGADRGPQEATDVRSMNVRPSVNDHNMHLLHEQGESYMHAFAS